MWERWLPSKKREARITNKSSDAKINEQQKSPRIGKKLEIWRREGGVGGIWHEQGGRSEWRRYVEEEEEEEETRGMPCAELGKEKEGEVETLGSMKDEGREHRGISRVTEEIEYVGWRYGKTWASHRISVNACLPRQRYALCPPCLFSTLPTNWTARLDSHVDSRISSFGLK